MATQDDEFDDGELAEEEFVDEGDDFAEEDGPKPRVSLLTVLLCLLNVAATIGFAVLLIMDYSKRQEWSHAVFMRDLALQGVALAQEADGPSAYHATMPEQRINPDKIKEAFRKRGGSVSESFTPVAEVFPNRILPQHLSDETLKLHFKGLGPPVRTLEDEIDRLRKELPNDILKAAQETTDKLDPKAKDPVQDKRNLLVALLLPLARTPRQIDDMYTMIQKVDPDKLHDLLIDVGQRRVLYDILAPLEYFRPSPVSEWPLEKIGDVYSKDPKKLDDYYAMLERRLKSAKADKFDPKFNFGSEWQDKDRDSIEKRQVIAFVLFTIGQARKPDGTPLYPQGADRVQKVIGLFEDAVAAHYLTGAVDKMTQRLLQLAIEDRDGKAVIVNNNLTSTDGFVQSYAKEIQRIKDITEVIKDRAFRLADLQDQEKKQADIVLVRQQHLDTVTAELIGERKKTAFQLSELQRVQRQLFEAQVKLADAHQTNLRLEQSIRRAEKVLKGELP